MPTMIGISTCGTLTKLTNGESLPFQFWGYVFEGFKKYQIDYKWVLNDVLDRLGKEIEIINIILKLPYI